MEPQGQIVGWALNNDCSCSRCDKPATVLIAEDPVAELVPLCDDCCPPDSEDQVLGILTDAVACRQDVLAS